MAIFHLSVKTVSRSTGRSAVAAAAYRSGDTLTNERDGRQHNYANRTGIDDSFIIAPAGCEWTHNRSTLWNAAEQAEKRSNSVTAREYVLALPAELDAKERAGLARAFASAVVERYGVAADVALHAPSAGGDDRNYHAHILTTTREVEADGLGKKTRILDAAKTGGPEIESLRELWAMQCNEALERHQQPARIDHRSYERQGVDEMPTIHLGPTSTAVERKHKAEHERKREPYKPQTFKAQENERRRSLNDHVREMVRELAETVRDVAEKAKSAKKRGIQALLRAVGAKRRDQEIEQARQAAEARRREEERKEALRQQALRDARERAVQEAKERMGGMAKRVQRLAPDARENFLAGEYPSDPFSRILKAQGHPLGIAGLDAEEKAVRAHLKVYQEQEKRQQAERVQAPTQGRGRGRGGPSRSRSRDYDSGPSF
ncbi:conjugal exonuclease V alpha subunit TraA/mobilization protein essential for specific plasmid transfer MobA/MobL [Komagataeibacter xylinus NBRC 13693]|uniref:Conjugal exonuclease V alpha subunit TraA/mobilization protein essential for specific plasmid transfer MobA/MobL n=1 Tax=Komagataeibacter xylinus NBRC 13693 TaxID=1234668 RepID=A0A0D6QC95_KOMXY|nr:MobQ family relaxase [Komagataeibacter xylinus]GAO00959.1 conjugal exonuclease V alpha subunit TraA/mobilization protein essential for specific plasmid transfer MobA/MobL [Komagataeibacter xylinus NBRC 13693]